MPLALVTGAARANSIAAGIVPRLRADGWQVVTSDLHGADYKHGADYTVRTISSTFRLPLARMS